MNDRELLELAAKAAGIHGFSCEDWTGVYFCTPANPDVPRSEPIIYKWLDDDGDAFRLASAMNQTVEFGNNMVLRPVEVGGEGADPLRATRRAIVRAAAEIGKGMK